MADRFAIATSERSIPPGSIESIIASASSPSSGAENMRDWKL